MMTTVLVIDDDPSICLFFTELLTHMAFESETANTLKDAETKLDSRAFDLVLLDLELPDGNGLELMPKINKSSGNPEIIIITGTGDARGAELAFKYGAWDYVQKPFLLDEVSLPITRALQYRKEKQSVKAAVPLVRSKIIGESDNLRQCLKEVATAAATDASVLITGETGTGKELFARAIHENSKRKERPFVAVDCGALPETLVESTLFGHEKGTFTGAGSKQDGLITQADGGTLMLDEVGDLPLNAQKSLLRALQERVIRPVGGNREIPVDIRLIAATNLSLDTMVEQQTFRQDLLYRIRAMEIHLPSLRDRKEDVEEIIVKKIHELTRKYQMENKAVSDEVVQMLSLQKWPGNVRELINVLEYMLASAAQDPTLVPKHLPPEYRVSNIAFEAVPAADYPSLTPPVPDLTEDLPTLNEYRDRLEKAYLKELINRSGGDRKKASELSGVSQSRLYGLLSKHHLPGFGRN